MAEEGGVVMDSQVTRYMIGRMSKIIAGIRALKKERDKMTNYVQTIRLYTCSYCGKQEEWGPTWLVYYKTPKSRHKKYLDPEVKYVVCSDQCCVRIDVRRR